MPHRHDPSVFLVVRNVRKAEIAPAVGIEIENIGLAVGALASGDMEKMFGPAGQESARDWLELRVGRIVTRDEIDPFNDPHFGSVVRTPLPYARNAGAGLGRLRTFRNIIGCFFIH